VGKKSATGQYVLGEDGRTPVPSGGREWSLWFEKASEDGARGRRVARTEHGGAVVSTVFLGLDHDFVGNGEPVLFETLIQGGEYDGWQNRYASWTLAELGHAYAVAMVKGGVVTIAEGDPAPEPEVREYRGSEVTLSIDGVELTVELTAFRSEMEKRARERLKGPAETLTQMADRLYAEMVSKEAAEQARKFLDALGTKLVARPFPLSFEGLPPRRPDESDGDYQKRVEAWLRGAA
jgi:hypothetical protein